MKNLCRNAYFLTGFLLSILLCISPASAVDNPRIVRVGAFNYFPGIFQDKDGQIKGFYVDALAEIEARENIKFLYVYGSWSEGLERIRNGDVDVLTSVAYTAERAQYLDYCGVPLLTVWGELYVSLDSEIDSITVIDKKSIAVMKDDFNAASFMDLVKKFGLSCNFVTFPSFEEVFNAVAAKKVDAGVVNSTFGLPKQKEYGLRATGIVFNPFNVYFAVGKGKNKDILLIFEKYLQNWRHQENSVYNKARQKWSHGEIGITKVVPIWIRYAIVALCFLVLVFSAFTFLLRKKVQQATSDILAKQASLRESQAILQSSIESPKDMIVLSIDLNYKYLCFNSYHRNVMQKAYGKNIELGMNLLDCITDESDRTKAKKNYDKSLSGTSHITIEEFGEEGRERSFYETRYNPIVLDGKIIGTTAFSSDVSERMRMLETLKESEEKYRTLLNISIDAVFVIQDYQIVYLNSAAVRLFGANRQEELLGKSPLELFHPDHWELVSERVKQMLESGNPAPLIEERIVRLDGSFLDAESAAIPFMHAGKRSIQVIMRDITERKKAENDIKHFNFILQKRIAERTEALEKANKELESFSYSVSHDLRAPLRAISGFSQLLEENYKGKLDNEGLRLLDVIRTNTSKMDNLINGLLNLSKVNKAELQYSSIDMYQLVDSIAREMIDSNAHQDFEISISPLPPAWADEVLIGQVWSNLLSNAFKYSMKSPTRKIEVGGRNEGVNTVYYIKDYGIGFDPVYADGLFNVFHRLHSSQEFEGIGIGLSIVKHILERHGGKVWAESQPEKGACFYFALPGKQQ